MSPDTTLTVVSIMKEAKEWGFPAVLLVLMMWRMDRSLFPLLKEYIQTQTKMTSAVENQSQSILMLTHKVEDAGKTQAEGVSELSSMLQESSTELEKLMSMVIQIESNSKASLEENRQTLKLTREIFKHLQKAKEATPNEQSSESV